jgi:predicted membrane channel-forming protein YqfA (hemolysin III family)
MTIHGLPAHPLLVHAVVVLMPLAAVAVVLHVLWPTARRRLGIVTPLLAGVVLVLVPITMRAGTDLARSFGANPLIERHRHLAHELPPWSIALFVVAVAVWGWRRPPRWAHVLLAVVAVAVAIGTTVTLLRVGDAGARATWGGV